MELKFQYMEIFGRYSNVKIKDLKKTIGQRKQRFGASVSGKQGANVWLVSWKKD